ncbi:MAG: hypothetical protein ACYCPT_07180 [Acidimicrobiales bacterium]
MKSTSGMLVRAARGFGTFWWDFFIGDTPEIFVAVLVIIGVIALVSGVGGWHAVAAIVLTVFCITALVSTLWRAKRAASK